MSSVVEEICFICNERNNINSARSKARYRMHYYYNAAYYVEEHAENEKKCRPKWIKMGSLKLREKALEETKKYVDAKIRTSKFTKRTHKKLMKLLTSQEARSLGIKLHYDNGYVHSIRVTQENGACQGQWASNYRWLSREEIKNKAQSYLTNKALEKMLLKSE